MSENYIIITYDGNPLVTHNGEIIVYSDKEKSKRDLMGDDIGVMAVSREKMNDHTSVSVSDLNNRKIGEFTYKDETDFKKGLSDFVDRFDFFKNYTKKKNF